MGCQGINIFPHEKYLDVVAPLLGLQSATHVPPPSIANVRQTMKDSPLIEDPEQVTIYRSALGSLMFYVQGLPDAQLELSMLGQYLKLHGGSELRRDDATMFQRLLKNAY